MRLVHLYPWIRVLTIKYINIVKDMKCEINILFVLSLIIFTLGSVTPTFEEPVKKGKMNKGVFNRAFVSYIL